MPPRIRMSMYCPARNCRRSFAGSFSWMRITSGASLSIFCTRHGSVRTWMSLTALISRHSITRSVSGFAWQNSA